MTGLPHAARILVIDDDAQRRSAYGTLLGGLASGVDAVASGAEAGKLKGQGYAAVLFHLDDGAGAPLHDVSAIARELEALGDAAVVLISVSRPDLGALAHLGADREAGPAAVDYLPAPIDADLLRSRVRPLLDLARLRLAAHERERTIASLQRLLSEHIHRGKNLLAIIQSIALRTLSDGRELAAARAALLGRLRSLSRVDELLSSGGAQGALLADILEIGLDEVSGRVSVAGPPIRIKGTFAQTFGLAIHELATNALRHGALQATGGTVAVGWTLFDTGADRYLELGWTERDGPEVGAAPERGFGLTLVSSLAPARGAPNYSFDGRGFSCRLRVPLEVVQPA